MRLVVLFFITSLASWSCSGSQSTSTLAPMPQAFISLPGVVIDAAWLAEHAKDVRIVDVRTHEAYKAGHVPGAVHLGAHQLSKGRDLATSDVVVQRFSEAGISQDFTVVVYGSHDNYRPPARVLWALELYGHPSVAVLNGGFEGWKATGHAISTDAVRAEPASFRTAMQPERLATTDDVIAATSTPEITVFDSRGASNYTGASGKEFAPRHGHIPTAVNVSSAEPIVEVDGIRMLPEVAVLQKLYGGFLQSSDKAITYCNGGNAASVGYLELRMLGIDVAMYDGSWAEWSTREELPMSTGPEPGSYPPE